MVTMRFCLECGKIRESLEEKLCNKCKHDKISDYEKIRSHIRNNPNANAMQIAQETGIAIHIIMSHIKSGAFMFKDSK